MAPVSLLQEALLDLQSGPGAPPGLPQLCPLWLSLSGEGQHHEPQEGSTENLSDTSGQSKHQLCQTLLGARGHPALLLGQVDPVRGGVQSLGSGRAGQQHKTRASGPLPEPVPSPEIREPQG